MQDMKQLLHEAHKSENNNKKPKERHIVNWTQQEDDILREQIGIHGTENWAVIASNFKDKTTRQCRRRWFTYLTSDCKKGGWSPEEDMILCEAQKIYGNRWTEIAKVVSGRTDNAVKNRFSTLCKKRAKHEALSKENNSSYINPNNKRVIGQNGLVAPGMFISEAPLKKTRTHTDLTENCNTKGRSLEECRAMENQQLRSPFSVLIQNFHNAVGLPAQQHVDNNTKAGSSDVGDNKVQGTFLKRDDPKITALMKQAELLSSLALKVNSEKTNQSFENAWKELQNFLNQSKENDMLRYEISEMDFQLEDFKDLIEGLKCSNMESWPSLRQPDLREESSGSSEYSTGSTFQSLIGDITEPSQIETCSIHQDTSAVPESGEIQNGGGGSAEGTCTDTSITKEGILPSCDEPKDHDGVVSALSNTEFSSPLQVTPLFRSLAAGIPSPKFSESERNFLLKTLGLESPSKSPSTKSSRPPLCRRALLHSL